MPASDIGATYTSGRRPKAAKERTRGDGARRMPRPPLWDLADAEGASAGVPCASRRLAGSDSSGL